MEQFEEFLRQLGDTTQSRFTREFFLRDGFGSNRAFSGLVAESETGIAGYLLYHFGYDLDAAMRNLQIFDLYVEQGRRKLGVGRAMMQHAENVCREAGGRQIVWSVYKSNPSARRFYERLGARLIDDEDFMYLDISA